MSEAAVRAALESRLNGLTPTLATAWENMLYEPVVGTPYQRVNVLPGETENPSIGAGLVRLSGILQVNLYYPTGTGMATVLARAEATRARFPRGQSMTSGSVTVIIPSTPSIGSGVPVEDRIMVPVRIPYRASIFA